MSLSLSAKKTILSITACVLVLGQVVNVATPNRNEAIAISNPVYAASSTEESYFLPPQLDESHEELNIKSIDEKLKDINLDKEQVRKIRAYLAKRGAPLADHAETFVRMAQKYDLPYNLMPAISIIESSGGLHNYRPYNYAGMGGQVNPYVFTSFDQAIETHAKILRTGYFDKGADTPYEIGQYYCYQCPTWGAKVQSVMNSIDSM
ncbi:glucosaminidase domain-containing protein [Candidatus Nomurabacteria bacterium]|nr:glucosaminidase domain-containing protein [Candidatus Nomurabacteria bacterium]